MPRRSVTLDLRPVVDTLGSPMQVSNGMTISSWIRIRNGYVQQLSGCLQLITGLFSGECTALLPWAALNEAQYLAVGTTNSLLVNVRPGDVLSTISPSPGVGSGIWSLDKWGEDLVAAPEGGTIYQWNPPTIAPAAPILNAPPVVNGIFVAAPEQQLIAWGAYSITLGAQDPLFIRWCDIGDLTDWTASTTNQAGSFRLSSGSRIWQGVWFGLSGLLWTDLDMWSMTYAGFPLVYSFNRIGSNCGAVSRRSAGVLGNQIAWMSQNNFFAYIGGQVQVITCSVWSFVFDNIDRANMSLVHCDTNSWGGEFVWRFPTNGSNGVCNAYAKWTPAEKGTWDCGQDTSNLSAWTDQSVIGPPIGADYNGMIQEFDNASRSINGASPNSGFTTGWFRIDEGQSFTFLERILPDFGSIQGTGIQLTVEVADEIPPDATDYPIRIYGPYAVTPQTPYIIVRARGRVFRLTLLNPNTDTDWRWGKPIAMVSTDGSWN